MRPGWLALSLTVAGFLVVAPLARAGGEASGSAAERVALLELRISGDAPAELRPQVLQAVTRGLSAAGLTAIPYEQVRSELAGTELLDCTSSACRSEIGDRLGADRFLRGAIDASGASYAVDLELIGRGEAPGRRVHEACEVCTMTELLEMVERLSNQLVTGVDAAPVKVELVSRPEGAALQIDGQPVGDAPYTGELAPGRHQVTALLTGCKETRTTIEVRADQPQQRFEIILERTRPDAPPPRPGRPFRTWKWVTAGGAGAALVGGMVLIAVDGSETCSKQPAQLECPRRLDTLAGGLVGVGVGVVAGAASAWMFVRDRRDLRAEPRLSFTHGGAIAGVAVRW